MKRLLCCIACVLALCGCSVIRENNEDITLAHLPSVSASPVAASPGEVKAVLYFLNESQHKLMGEKRILTLEKTGNIAETAIAELLKGPQNASLKKMAENITLDRVEVSDDLACVYVNASAPPPDKEMYLFEAAAVNTLSDLLGVSFVDVFWNGVKKGISGAPWGPLTKTTGNVDAEFEKALGEASQKIYSAKEYRVMLFFAAKGEDYILPEARNIIVTGSDYAGAVIEELKKGPLDTGRKSGVLEKSVEVEEAKTVKQGKTQTLELSLTGFTRPSAYGDPESEFLTYASIVYTLTGFLPDIDSVRIKADGVEIAELQGYKSFREGMRRQDFAGRLGKSVTVYLKHKDSSLLAGMERTVAQSAQWDAGTRLAELFQGPKEQDGDIAWPVIPAGVGEKDILSADTDRDTLLLNMSANFAESCKNLTEEGETLLVYGIVNTLTEVFGVRRVKFLVEGREISELAGYLYLKSPLVKNPGIVRN